MFSSLSELKEFILWAKMHEIEALKVGDVEVHFSKLAAMAALPDALAYKDIPGLPLTEDQEKARQKEEDELLFHSAN